MYFIDSLSNSDTSVFTREQCDELIELLNALLEEETDSSMDVSEGVLDDQMDLKTADMLHMELRCNTKDGNETNTQEPRWKVKEGNLTLLHVNAGDFL